MSLREKAGRPRLANRLLQVGIVGVLLAGLAGRNVSVVVNAAGGLAVTFLPAVLARDYRIQLPAWIVLWITAAVLLHAVGMLGPYHSVWWWDHVTHAMSATVVAGVGYATARAVDLYSDAVRFPTRFLFVYVLLFTLALGVLWEVLEFAARGGAEALGYGPVLVQYGLEDTILDLVFDAAGAAVVAAFARPSLSGVVGALVARLRDRSVG